MCIAARRFPVKYALLCASVAVVLAALPALAATVSGVSGSLVQRSTLTITGSDFGNAPTVVVFDDFEGGTNGNTIPTGAGSALIGQWDAKAGNVIYSNTTAVSGSLSFRADALEPHFGVLERYLPPTTDFFMSWWMYIPSGDNLPGEGTVDGTNWKVMWVLGEGGSTVDDDTYLPACLAIDSWVIGGNDSPYGKWPDLDFHKGEWKRVWAWEKGGYNNDGQCHFWELDSTNAVLQRVNDNNVTIMYEGGMREQVNVNGYCRITPDCHPTFDDVYIAVGSNARARVEIGNSSTYNNCTQMALCPSTSWSGTSITAKCNLGGLSGGPWYLFVVDATGSVSSGYQLAQDTYTLTVNSGSGDGECYSGQVVAVAADAAPSGMIFNRWTGDTAGLASATAASTTYTMPAHSAAITATYRAAESYLLTVHGGTGSGTYVETSVVAISANPPASGYVFTSWTGDTACVANTHAASTTVTMPRADAQVTATYSPASQTLKFREGGGAGYVNVTFDDTWIKHNPADDTTHGDDPNDAYEGIQCSTSKVSLIAVKDLFTQLPKTTGGCQIGISLAKLHLFGYQGEGNTVSIYRLVTNWLPGAAGTNENNVSGQHAVKSANTHWAGGGNFSTSDYDTSVVSTGSWAGYNQDVGYDVTQQVARMYDVSQNYGLVLSASTAIYGRSSENSSNRPYLEVSYYYLPIGYSLTVNSGTGGGTYTQGTVVNIAANAAPSSMAFDKWIGNTANVANVNASSTTLTMPASAVTVTAAYVPVYQLTVNSGTGDGQYKAGTVVAIQADAAASGTEFSEWTGDVATVADPSAAATTITMPASAAEVTATYSAVVPPLLGDLNDDGFVGQQDLNLVLGQWGRGAPPHEPIIDSRADANHDNFVGQADLNMVLSHWGEGTLPPELPIDP